MQLHPLIEARVIYLTVRMVVVLVCLLGRATITTADPFTPTVTVTGGSVVATMPLSLRTEFHLFGDDFSIDVTSSSGHSVLGATEVLVPGTPYSFDAFASSPFGGSITYQGTVYPLSFSIFGNSTGGVTFTSAPFVLPATGASGFNITEPFSVEGQIGFINSPTHRLVLEFSSGGIATAHATRFVVPPNEQTPIAYGIREIDYTFGVFGVTPTPEPATILMFACGLIGAAMRYRRT